MLSIIVFILALSKCALTQTAAPTVPISEFDCSAQSHNVGEDHLYPDPHTSNPDQCSTMYRCLPGQTEAHKLTCAADGLVFSETAQACAWPYSVPPPCGTMVSTAPTFTGTYPTITPDSVNFDCTGRPDGEYISPLCCTKFYTCDGTTDGSAAIAKDCPDGLVFNPAIEQCDWPSANPTCTDMDCSS